VSIDKLYSCILADPPWRYNDQGTRLSPSYEGKQKKSGREYETMSLEDICALGPGVKAMSADNALLLLWVPNPLINTHPWPVIESWGFHFSTFIPWTKARWDAKQERYIYNIGGGHSVRSCAESLLVCSKGKISSIIKSPRNVPGAIIAPSPRRKDSRGVRHSAKPEEQYLLAERLVDGPFCELFARETREHWTSIGNGIDNRDIREVLGVIPCSVQSVSFTGDSTRPCTNSTQTILLDALGV
jgi:N6-adenosine-specific RNA methylase IME4